VAGQINFSGNIVAGPGSVTDLSAFPGGIDTIPISTTPAPKSYTRREHKETQFTGVTNQALDFTGISATFVYLRADVPITFRVNGGTQDLPLHGMVILETSTATPAAPVTAITVTVPSGVTAQIEYFIAGA
jgi:hypothetical protein